MRLIYPCLWLCYAITGCRLSTLNVPRAAPLAASTGKQTLAYTPGEHGRGLRYLGTAHRWRAADVREWVESRMPVPDGSRQ